MEKNSTVRVKSISLVINDKNEMLVSGDYDSAKKHMFYVPLGGHVEFGELTIDTVKREFMEEIGAGLTNITLVTVLENIFTWNGNPGHEINFVYKADITDKSFYERKEIPFIEERYHNIKAVWLNVNDCIEGKFIFYPEQLREILKGLIK